jgi:hypothetical protein
MQVLSYEGVLEYTLTKFKTGKPTLCNARGDEGFDIAHVRSVQGNLYRLEREEEEEARLNFIASVKPETAAAILGNAAENGISVIFKVQEVTGGGNVY